MGKGFAPLLVILMLSLIALDTVFVLPVKAQYQGDITINIDGSISPSTAPIQQTTNVYSLISNIIGHLIVHASNIIFDGNGHTVSSILSQGTFNVIIQNFVVTMRNQFTETIGILIDNASNNIIINNTISGFWSIYALNGILFAGISVRDGNSNTITQNNLMYNLAGIAFANTSYNLIVQNNVTSNPVWSPYTIGIIFFGASNNTVYRNNFVNNRYQAQITNSVNVWDNGYPNGGNYWSGYEGQGPYRIDRDNIDHHPLTQQGDIYSKPPIPTLTPTPTVPEFQIPLIVTLIIGVAGLLVYFKKHRRAA